MSSSRGILSCLSCRQRKLRCDREEPCGNCKSRQVSCNYVLRRAAERQDNNRELESRIRHLERLITDLSSSRASNASGSNSPGRASSDSAEHSHDSDDQAPVLPPSPRPTLTNGRDVKSGKILNDSERLIYVSPDHWAAIHDEISSLRTHVEMDSCLQEASLADQVHPEKGLMLLEGLAAPTSLQEVLLDIPPRPIADRLVAKFFQSNERIILCVHGPQFLETYREFWEEPSSASPAWISVLYGVLLNGVLLCVRAGEPLPSNFALSPPQVLEVYQRRAAECLVMANYSVTPGKYTLEALILHGQSEFIRRPNAQVGLWVLCGVAIRLGYRLGYHRDPKHYSQISMFEGEIRRRIWAHLVQFDVLSSYQVGLPTLIQDRHYDCEPPRNIFDEDLDMNCTELPPSRPETEMTPILYTIAKGRVLGVFKEIFDLGSHVRMTNHDFDKVAILEQKLSKAIASIPPRLRLVSATASLIIPPSIRTRQYNLALLGLKSSLILHRHYMAESYQNPKYEHSRHACLEAAMTLLMHQGNILSEVQPAGLLFTERWFITSLEHHDFLLAAMVICLELSVRMKSQVSMPTADDGTSVTYSSEQLIEAVRRSQQFWYIVKDQTRHAQQACDILNLMLSRISAQPADINGQAWSGSQRAPEQQQQPQQPPQPRQHPFPNGPPPPYTMHQNGHSSTYPTQNGTGTAPPAAMQQPHEGMMDGAFQDMSFMEPGMQEISDMLINPDLIDWGAWETAMQSSRPQ